VAGAAAVASAVETTVELRLLAQGCRLLFRSGEAAGSRDWRKSWKASWENNWMKGYMPYVFGLSAI
jgi:hypothetical protein